jgi:cell division septation protein DedD
MSEEQQVTAEDSSHYEVSLTAGQAFVAFVLLLASLAAAFIFGLMVGKGQDASRLVVRREPSVIQAGDAPAKANEAKIIELGVPEEEEPEVTATETATAEVPVVVEEAPAGVTATTAAAAEPAASTPAHAAPVREEVHAAPPKSEEPVAKAPSKPEPKPAAAKIEAPASATGTVYAQVFSSGDGAAAEALAAKLIDNGFKTAYVERTRSLTGMTYRVRVRFPSEETARGSADRLRSITRTEPWITRQ